MRPPLLLWLVVRVVVVVARPPLFENSWNSLEDLDDECREVLEREGLLEALERPLGPCGSSSAPRRAMVIGAGIGTTGTRSIAKAVDMLGIPTCHHCKSTLRAFQSLAAGDARRFLESGAWFDDPVGKLYRNIACAFPQSYKVILTVKAVFHRNYGGHRCSHKLLYRERNATRCIQYGRICPTKDEARDIYLKHVDDVIATVPADRLLVMNISDRHSFTWERLQRFLGLRLLRRGGLPYSKEWFCNKYYDDNSTVGLSGTTRRARHHSSWPSSSTTFLGVNMNNTTTVSSTTPRSPTSVEDVVVVEDLDLRADDLL
mmetsp:Transcript_13283/g.43272  ORF Transcript_13283/g.43272 Transcript_13283/m.43272 type:complete len:316 (+) Transcript_13283:73-1020(+)